MSESLDSIDWNRGFSDPAYFAFAALGVELHPGQRKWLENSTRPENVLVTGNRWGKSFVSAVKILHRAIYRPRPLAYDRCGRYRIVTASITQDQANIIFSQTLQLARRSPVIEPLILNVTRTPYPRLEFGNGATVEARSTQNRGEYLLGNDYDLFIFDEVAFETDPEYVVEEVIQMRLADREGRLDLVSTPNGKNWFYLRSREIASGKRRGYFQSGDSRENCYISQDFLADRARHFSEARVQQNIMGQFADTGGEILRGAYVDRALARYERRMKHRRIPPRGGRRYVSGWDLARKQTATVGITVAFENGAAWIISLERFKMFDWKVVTERIKDRQEHYAGTLIVDATGLGDVVVEQLAEYNPLPMIFTPSSKAEMLTNVELFHARDAISYPRYELPDGAFGSDFMWSPDGGRLAFLAHLRGGTELWIADVSTGELGPVSDARVLATIGTSARGQGSSPSRMVQWTPEGTVLTLLVPADRGAEPDRNPVPSSPMIRRTREKPNPFPTYPNLLRDDHDAVLFEFYITSQLAELTPGQPPKLLGEPGMYESIALSPDGQFLKTTRIDHPFSYIAPYSGFPRKTEVLDREGNLVSTVTEQPLRETRQRNGNNDEPREWSWRPHRDGSVLTYLLRGEEPEDDDEPRLDQLMMLAAPFDTSDARVIATSEDRMSGHRYSLDGRHVFVTVTKDGERGIATFELRRRNPDRNLLVDFYDTDELVSLPGALKTSRHSNGLEYVVLSSNGRAVYLEGPGYKEDFKPQPFVDRVALRDGETERLFEGASDSFDRPLVLLDPDMSSMIVSRESKADFPDSYLWTDDGSFENLTNNVDPFPHITAARRVDFQYARRDGLEVQGRISLPTSYREGERVPAIFWTYPREYETNEEYTNASIRRRNHNSFMQLSWLRWSDIWLTQGYAIVYPDIPIVGENYNDTYISNMVDAMYGALRAVDTLGYIDIDRIGHGGHSYGAFATANLLAHTPFFKAGIAGDGAYNRTLTPMGFQAERRDIWEAPQTYLEISPFFSADQINTPLLMYHGAVDNNTGTYPVQSERLMMALTGLGKTAVLYMYPFESHTPRAIENNLDMWARWLEWFDRYVKEEPQN